MNAISGFVEAIWDEVMKRKGWKGQKAEQAGQPTDSGHNGKVVADEVSSPERSCQDEKRTKTVTAERETAPSDLKQTCRPEAPNTVQDEAPANGQEIAALEAASDSTRASIQDSNIDGGSAEIGDAADDDREGEAVGWTIQLTRGRIVDVTDQHVILSDDSLGFITFEDGEALSIEGIRRIGW